MSTAIQTIYRDLEYATTLSKRRNKHYDGAADEFEETWTFIGDESDPELKRSMAAERESPAPKDNDSHSHGVSTKTGTGVSDDDDGSSSSGARASAAA